MVRVFVGTERFWSGGAANFFEFVKPGVGYHVGETELVISHRKMFGV